MLTISVERLSQGLVSICGRYQTSQNRESFEAHIGNTGLTPCVLAST